MKENETAGLKPIHETIVEAIQTCESPAEFLRHGQWIKKTKLPTNYEAIIDAIDRWAAYPGKDREWLNKFIEIKKSVLAQRDACAAQTAAAEVTDQKKIATAKANRDVLLALYSDNEALLIILSRHNSNLPSYIDGMTRHLMKISKILSQALGI